MVKEMRYTDFWGEDESGWSLPFRCKVCPDGIGESADIAVSDTWPGGSPDPKTEDQDAGANAMIARTVAGHELLEAAIEDGALGVIGDDLGPEDVGVCTGETNYLKCPGKFKPVQELVSKAVRGKSICMK